LTPTLLVPDKYLRIGLNFEYFYIIRENNYLTQVVKIKLDKLVIKFSGFLMVIIDEERDYRLICDDAFLFRCVL
jgi:hypothetical protein